MTLLGMNQSASVTVPNAADAGRYSTTARASLKCRLFAPSTDTPPLRAGERPAARLLFDASYAMPAAARVTIDGTTYQVVGGTVRYPKGPSGKTSHGACEVVTA